MFKKIEELVERLSLRLKIDLKFILRGGTWLGLAQVFSTLCSFLLVLVLTKYLSKEAYGEYKYILTIFGIVATIGLSGYGPAIASSISRGKDGIYKKARRQIFWYSFPASIASILVGIYYLTQGNINLFLGLVTIGLVNPATSSYQIYTSFLTGKKDFKNITLLGAIPDILTFLFTVLAIFYSQNAGVLASVFLVTNLLATFVAWYLTEKKYEQNNEAGDAESEYHGKHNSIISIFSSVIQNLDKVFVFHYLGAAELAIYSIATQVPDQLKGVFKIVPDLIMAKYSEKMHLQNNNIWLKLFYLFLVVVVMIVGYIVFAPLFYKIFFADYANYTYLSQIYSFSLLAVVAYYPLTIIQAHLKTKELYSVTIASSIVQLVSAYVGVVYFGLIGIVIARIVTRLFTLLAYLVALRQIIK